MVATRFSYNPKSSYNFGHLCDLALGVALLENYFKFRPFLPKAPSWSSVTIYWAGCIPILIIGLLEFTQFTQLRITYILNIQIRIFFLNFSSIVAFGVKAYVLYTLHKH